MARSTRRDEAPKGDFVELVHPTDSSRKETPLNAVTDARLRFDGWLPQEQAELEAPKPEDSGSSALTGAENTVGSNS